jgi:hypothetical protein
VYGDINILPQKSFFYFLDENTLSSNLDEGYILQLISLCFDGNDFGLQTGIPVF